MPSTDESLIRPARRPKEDDEMTATITSAYRVAAGEGIDNVFWKTGRMTIKAGGPETGGAFAQLETDDPRGGGPPRHLHHNEDESFYILEGEVTALVGDERIDLGAGDYCYAPRGVAHSYVVRSEHARMLVTLTPSGLEELFVSLGAPAEGAQPPTDAVLPPPDELARVFGDRGVEILGPPLSLSDVS
jgi:quercetin dioxygenase-like cupin family protein